MKTGSPRFPVHPGWGVGAGPHETHLPCPSPSSPSAEPELAGLLGALRARPWGEARLGPRGPQGEARGGPPSRERGRLAPPGGLRACPQPARPGMWRRRRRKEEAGARGPIRGGEAAATAPRGPAGPSVRAAARLCAAPPPAPPARAARPAEPRLPGASPPPGPAPGPRASLPPPETVLHPRMLETRAAKPNAARSPTREPVWCLGTKTSLKLGKKGEKNPNLGKGKIA